MVRIQREIRKYKMASCGFTFVHVLRFGNEVKLRNFAVDLSLQIFKYH